MRNGARSRDYWNGDAGLSRLRIDAADKEGLLYIRMGEKNLTNNWPEPVAAVPYIAIDGGGDHHLIGSRCGNCGATLLGKRLGCAACGVSDRIEQVRLSGTGRIRTCSVLSRSYPGVPVPFIAAVVDLDGGGVVRGTLLAEIPADPSVEVGKPVRICIEDTGQRDPSGRPFYSHVFRPLEAAA